MELHYKTRKKFYILNIINAFVSRLLYSKQTTHKIVQNKGKQATNACDMNYRMKGVCRYVQREIK